MEKSFWDLPQAQQYPSLRGRIKADAVIIGGGLGGVTAALWLSRAGLKTVVVEAETLGFGASSRCAGVVSLCGGRPLAGIEKVCGAADAAAYVSNMKSAFQSVRETAIAANAGWQEISAMVFRSGGDLKAEKEAFARAGIAVQLHERKGESCFSVDQMGMLHPQRYLYWMAQGCTELGGRIFEKSRVLSVEISEIRTEGGVVQAPYIIVATGYPIINVPGWYFLRLNPHESSVFLLSGDTPPENLWMEANGAYMLRPLKRGALLHWRGIDGENPPDEEALLSNVRKIALGAGLHWNGGRWSGMEYATPDGLPFIGPYGVRTPNLFVACGYEEKGILGSMMVAQAIAARILGLPSDGYEIFSGQRMRRGGTAALRMGGKYIRAFARRPSAPRCPHMGCRLAYNAQSRLWECPCHGSAFDDIGHVIRAPAVTDAVLQGRRNQGIILKKR